MTITTASAYAWLLPAEIEREELVRTVVCPVCRATCGRGCSYQCGTKSIAAHTGRYQLATAVGLVPPLPGASKTPPPDRPDGPVKQPGKGGPPDNRPPTRNTPPPPPKK